MLCPTLSPFFLPPNQMRSFIRSLFKRLEGQEPIGDGMTLVGRDRDNWFVRLGDKTTHVYAPTATLFSRRKLVFHGVTSSTWDPPHDNICISKEEKSRVEKALLTHLTNKGVMCIIVDDEEC